MLVVCRRVGRFLIAPEQPSNLLLVPTSDVGKSLHRDELSARDLSGSETPPPSRERLFPCVTGRRRGVLVGILGEATPGYAPRAAKPAVAGILAPAGRAEDHAAYIANWLEVLKADNRAIFTAASHAQRAADFINGLQPAASAG